jgi:DNA-binding NarL/FixJ family response regulator
VSAPVRVFVLWQYRVLGEALAHALDERDGITVVGTSGDPRQAQERLARDPADVLLLDASVRPERAVELTADLRRRLPVLRVMPFGLARVSDVLAFFESGAIGYLPGNASLEETVSAVTDGDGGRSVWPLELAARLAARVEELSGAARRPRVGPPEPFEDPLSAREHEVLALVARGLANKEIAGALGIRSATVKNHVHAVLTKLGARRRTDAVRVAFERGLLEGPFRWCPLDRSPCPLEDGASTNAKAPSEEVPRDSR